MFISHTSINSFLLLTCHYIHITITYARKLLLPDLFQSYVLFFATNRLHMLRNTTRVVILDTCCICVAISTISNHILPTLFPITLCSTCIFYVTVSNLAKARKCFTLIEIVSATKPCERSLVFIWLGLMTILGVNDRQPNQLQAPAVLREDTGKG